MFQSEVDAQTLQDGEEKVKDHNKKRDDTTFHPIYMNCDEDVKSFVHQENPLLLNERLTIQQGLFLCPGNAAQPFLKNLKEMDGWNSEKNVYKLRLVLTHAKRTEFARMLKSMNLSSASIVPGARRVCAVSGRAFVLLRRTAKEP